MSTNIYVLALEHGKYYVGKTTDPASRIFSHFSGYGSAWTRLHRPVRVVEVRQNASSLDEDEVTKEYMNKYGVQNVRGGSYTQIQLDENELGDDRRETIGALDRCLRCGRFGHWAKNCYARSAVIVCYRCGREGHTSPECYARTGVFH